MHTTEAITVPTTALEETLPNTEGAPPRCCRVNSFDNVRVMRGQMTIRCRVCEKKIRAQVEKVKIWKCETFWSKGCCEKGDDCYMLHLHFRKRSLKERVDAHGPRVLDPVLRAHGAPLRDPSVVALLNRFRGDDSVVSTPAASPTGTPVASPRATFRPAKGIKAPIINLDDSINGVGSIPSPGHEWRYAVTPEAESDSDSSQKGMGSRKSTGCFRYDPYGLASNCVEV
eukprot:TRINITY_DN786_c1_g1_i1.p1 TRINITY_DN786_c1_g1~~TRINITY_DN786_c1_g1_i1.p1  ORF type:complete len:228 (+),score=14.43 TRINITY_DN786_c1_g1_i1:177-860(+)